MHDAVIILCGGLYKKPDGTYAPTSYKHCDEFGMLGGQIRITAAIEIYLHEQATTFCFSTGVSQKQISKFGTTVPSEASIYRDVFLDQLKQHTRPVQPQIFLDETSVNTTSNLQEVISLAQKKNWISLAIISNDYHIPRITQLYSLVQKQLSATSIEATFLSAEKIVQRYQPNRYDAEIAAAYNTKEGLQRIINEQKGVQDIMQKKYILTEYQLAKNN